MALTYPLFQEKEKNSFNRKDPQYDFKKYYTKLSSTNTMSDSTKSHLDNYIKKINFITTYNTHTLGIILDKLYKKYFKEYFPDIEKKEIITNTFSFFNMQNSIENINKEFYKFTNIINLQIRLCNNYSRLIGFLTNDSLDEINTVSSLKIKENPEVREYVEKYLKNIRIYKASEDKKNVVYKSDEEKNNYENLKACLEGIVKDLLIYSSNIICYGSYTSYNVDPNCEYHDIDIYHNQAFDFIICIMNIIKIITNIDTSILHIPYITGHLSLRYNSHTLLDCIYIDAYTFNFLNPVRINNRIFINPGIQMLNNIRMSNEIFRLTNLYYNTESNIKKYSALFNYFLSSNNMIPPKSVDEDTLRNLLQYKIINRSIIIFDLKPIYEHLGLEAEYDKLVIFLSDPKFLMEYITRHSVKGRFSKKFHAFLNEIFFEKEASPIIKEEEVRGTGNTIIVSSTLLNRNQLILQTIKELDSEIRNSKALIMTHFNSSLYINDKLHELSIQSIFSTLTMYHYLHSKDNSKEFYGFLLNLLLLKISNINDYIVINRLKRQGDHVTISINPVIFGTTKFYQEREQEWFDVEYFLNKDINDLMS